MLKLLYGLGYDQCYSLQEVAHIFKVARERIRQIEAKVIAKLKAMGALAGEFSMKNSC